MFGGQNCCMDADKKITVLLMHQTVAQYDAIGTDIEIMYEILCQQYKCFVYAENQFNKNVEYVDDTVAESILAQESNLVIYHHSVYWAKGEELLHNTKAKLVFRYHNITPENFFQRYSSLHYSQCKKGREQTIRYLRMYPDAFWLSDSKYNTTDLAGFNKDNIEIIAPFHKIEKWLKETPNEKILKELIESEEINLLFVGRVAPNKGHLFLLEILRVFILNYHCNIKLRIIGKFDSNLAEYNQLIHQKIKQYRLDNCVEFIGEINDSSLMSYYLGSDLFICASEHEGFCVPILEAQFLALPIIALNSSALPDTGGKGQVLLEKDARLFAAAIKILMEDTETYTYIKDLGYENVYTRFSFEYMSNEFRSIIEKLLGGIK